MAIYRCDLCGAKCVNRLNIVVHVLTTHWGLDIGLKPSDSKRFLSRMTKYKFNNYIPLN